jgi:hypothetical protein
LTGASFAASGGPELLKGTAPSTIVRDGVVVAILGGYGKLFEAGAGDPGQIGPAFARLFAANPAEQVVPSFDEQGWLT